MSSGNSISSLKIYVNSTRVISAHPSPKVSVECMKMIFITGCKSSDRKTSDMMKHCRLFQNVVEVLFCSWKVLMFRLAENIQFESNFHVPLKSRVVRQRNK